MTGLKYFCKTTKSDPYKYAGSGLYWLRHLKTHGRFWDTEIIGFYTNREDCTNAALKYSVEHNIINAVNEGGYKIWANCINENGLDGGATTQGGPRSPDVVKRAADAMRIALSLGKRRSLTSEEKSAAKKKELETKRKNGTLRSQTGWKPSDESKEKIRKTLTGRKQSLETIEKRRKSLTGKKYSKSVKNVDTKSIS